MMNSKVGFASILVVCSCLLLASCGDVPGKVEDGISAREITRSNTPSTTSKGIEIVIPGLGAFRLGPVQPGMEDIPTRSGGESTTPPS